MLFEDSIKSRHSEYASQIDDVNKAFSLLSDMKLQVVDAKTFRGPCKTAWKVKMYGQFSLHRVLDISSEIASAWKNGNSIVSLILIRCLMEHSASTYHIAKQLSSLCKELKLEEIDEFVMKRLFGTKLEGDLPKIPNILGSIDAFDKSLSGYRTEYERLCEYAHPNCMGMLSYYGKLDQKENICVIDPENKLSKENFSRVIWNFRYALKAFEFSYVQLMEWVPFVAEINNQRRQNQEKTAAK